jgi:hypothetical protein
MDVDRLIDAIGRPYRWDLFLVRIMITVIIIILALWKLIPLVLSDRVSDYKFLRGLVLSIIGIYGLIEFFIGYCYFKRLKRLRQII